MYSLEVAVVGEGRESWQALLGPARELWPGPGPGATVGLDTEALRPCGFGGD